MKRGLDYVNVDCGTAESSSHVDVEAALQSATSMGTHVSRHRMPWEATPLMHSVFGHSAVLDWSCEGSKDFSCRAGSQWCYSRDDFD